MNWGKDDYDDNPNAVEDAREHFQKKTRGKALTEGERRDFAREANQKFRTIMTADELDE